MRRILLGAAAMIVVAVPALAADLQARKYTKAPAYTAPEAVYNWTGFYIGGNLGGAFAGNNSLQGSGGRFMGGVEGGFDYQFAPNWVVGAEAQYDWLSNNNNGRLFPGGVLVTSKNNELGSVTGRVGYTWGPALLYGKGGFAFRDNNNFGVTVAGVPAGFTTNGKRQDGYTVGAGLEYMFAPSWSAKAEYQYYNFGSTTFTTGPPAIVGTRFKDDEHTVKAGSTTALAGVALSRRTTETGRFDATKGRLRAGPFLWAKAVRVTRARTVTWRILRQRSCANHCGRGFSFAGPDCTLDPKINFGVCETSARDRLLYSGQRLDNEHAGFCVRADFMRSYGAVPGSDRPEIRTTGACAL